MKTAYLLACLWILWQATDQRDIQVLPGGSVGHIHWVYVGTFETEAACQGSDKKRAEADMMGRLPDYRCLPLGLTPREAGF